MKFFLFSLVLVTYFTINSARQGRIIRGDEASPHQFPYQVALSTDGGGSYCGGSLISNLFVLTAAHCLAGKNSVRVILGAHNRNQRTAAQTEQLITNPNNVKIHENFNPQSLANDIALIKMNGPVPFNQFISPVLIPQPRDANLNFVGTRAVVSGWGQVQNRQLVTTPILRYAADQTVITNNECHRYFTKPPVHVRPTNICTFNRGGERTCRGDSGGPLVARDSMGKNVLIGIVSFGQIDCSTGSPSVFTRVTSYLKWIYDNTDVPLRQ